VTAWARAGRPPSNRPHECCIAPARGRIGTCELPTPASRRPGFQPVPEVTRRLRFEKGIRVRPARRGGAGVRGGALPAPEIASAGATASSCRRWAAVRSTPRQCAPTTLARSPGFEGVRRNTLRARGTHSRGWRRRGAIDTLIATRHWWTRGLAPGCSVPFFCKNHAVWPRLGGPAPLPPL